MNTRLKIGIDNYRFAQRVRRISTRTKEAADWWLRRTPCDKELPMLLRRQV